MVNVTALRTDRLGVLGGARSVVCPAPAVASLALAELPVFGGFGRMRGGATGVITGQRGTKQTAPQTYLNVIDPQSAALQERSP